MQTGEGIQVDELTSAHPWLRDPALEVSAVGSLALYRACAGAGLPLPPAPADLDLAWRLGADEGRAFLAGRGLEAAATPGNEARGTLATRLGERRVEITTYRGGGSDADERIRRDGCLRDMTIGALYWRLWDDRIEDPVDGLADWREGRVRACGLATDRIQEHPVRALRYLRKTVELGFVLETSTRRGVEATTDLVARKLLPDALAEELRRVLARCTSPGAFFQMCQEARLLAKVLPEVAPIFDGRPAGRMRWHPEVSQALHMVLALKAAAGLAAAHGLDDRDRHLFLMGVLCHDLGKGGTDEDEMPSHPGHEAGGVEFIDRLFRRVPALGDKGVERFCKVAARNHLLLERLRQLRPGTLVDLWDRDLRTLEDRFDLLARVVRCDREGRLTSADLGLPQPPQAECPEPAAALEARILADLLELDTILRAVSGHEAAALHPGDPAALREHLRRARCDALTQSGFLDGHDRQKAAAR
ncbi:MAG: HD domain-containing protein [Planctomycetota bacterium]